MGHFHELIRIRTLVPDGRRVEARGFSLLPQRASEGSSSGRGQARKFCRLYGRTTREQSRRRHIDGTS